MAGPFPLIGPCALAVDSLIAGRARSIERRLSGGVFSSSGSTLDMLGLY